MCPGAFLSDSPDPNLNENPAGAAAQTFFPQTVTEEEFFADKYSRGLLRPWCSLKQIATLNEQDSGH